MSTGVLTPGGLTALPESQLRSCIDQCLLLIGDALHAKLNAPLTAALGSNWWSEVSAKNGAFARRDLASYRDCLDGDGRLAAHRDAFREAFGRELYRRSQRSLKAALEVRNDFAHPHERLDVAGASRAIARLLAFAQEAELGCLQELRGIANAIEKCLTGKAPAPASEAEVAELRRRVETLQAENATREQALAEALAQEEGRKDHIAELQAQIEQHARRRTEARHRETELLERLRDRALQEDESTRLQAELADIRRDNAEREKAMRRADGTIGELNAALASQSRDVQTLQQRAEAAEERSDALLAELAMSRARSVGEGRTQLDSQLQALANSLSDVSAVGDEVPAPGELWVYDRGTEVWTLSAARAALVRVSDEADLGDLMGQEAARKLVQRFLSVRPTGGRVWVDEDGDAVTFVEGRLVYLGRLFTEDEHGELTDPPLGTPVESSGRKYSVTTFGIQHVGTGQWLSEVVAAASARQVRDRLLQVRPEGGRYRVDSTGCATTYVEGRWVFAGRVMSHEWFPGQLSGEQG